MSVLQIKRHSSLIWLFFFPLLSSFMAFGHEQKLDYRSISLLLQREAKFSQFVDFLFM